MNCMAPALRAAATQLCASFAGTIEQWTREEARRWYELGFKENQSAHWLGVQHLSLEAVLRGSIAQPWQWQAVLGAARTACESAKECWAAGTRAELHLLAPCAGQQPQLGEAVAALRDLEKRVGGGDRFPLESTARQLARYASWWTSAGGFFPGAKDLANEVRGVMEEAGCGKWTT